MLGNTFKNIADNKNGDLEELNATEYMLAKMYAIGIGIEKNPNKALELFKNIEESEVTEYLGVSELFLGTLYFEQCDFIKAFKSFKRVVELNGGSNLSLLNNCELCVEERLTIAEYYLGFMYLEGYGTEKNIGEANKLLKDAANKGYSTAIKFLKDISCT